MRWLPFILLIAVFVMLLAFLKMQNKLTGITFKNAGGKPLKAKPHKEADLLRLKAITRGVKDYAHTNGFSSQYCFLIDMKMPSGSKRFYIYDIQNNSILQSGLVAHGSGNENTSDSIVFSNRIGSNCTSLGKYKIGKPYFGKFGLAYKLYGLDKTNCNAFSRFVVLHSHACVPDKAIEPQEICKSWGCPTVSPLFLGSLKNYIDKSQRPLLLWIFY